jgi:hypothetical protein
MSVSFKTLYFLKISPFQTQLILQTKNPVSINHSSSPFHYIPPISLIKIHTKRFKLNFGISPRWFSPFLWITNRFESPGSVPEFHAIIRECQERGAVKSTRKFGTTHRRIPARLPKNLSWTLFWSLRLHAHLARVIVCVFLDKQSSASKTVLSGSWRWYTVCAELFSSN